MPPPIRNSGPRSAGAVDSTSKAEKPQTPAVEPSTPKGKPWGAAPAASVTVKSSSGMEAASKPRSSAALTGAAPPPPASAVRASTAVAFDAIQAPGGPAKARLLSDGLDSWNARLDLIENAKTSLDASYFIMEKDPYGYAFLGGLLKKQLEGVQVRVSTDAMADTFGKNGFKMPGRGKDFLQEIVNHGGQAFIYHPIHQRAGDLLKGDYSVLSSNHDKILVADGQRGITGGRNVAQDYFASAKDFKTAWRDMDVLLDGRETAKGLVEAFDAELVNGDASVPVSKDRLGNWDKKDLQLLGAYEMMQAWTRQPALTDAQKAELKANPAVRQQYVEALVKTGVDAANAALPEKLKRSPSKDDLEFLRENASRLVDNLETRGSRALYDQGGSGTHQTEVKIIDQTSAASSQRVNNMAPALMQLVEGASKRIVIENPYVVLTQDMVKALERASARGVQIDIITNSPLSTDSDVTQAFFLEDWQMILQRCPTARVFVATGDRKFHGKSAVIDDDQTVVSTYNLDLLSGFVNSEVGAVVKSKELAKDLMLAFEDDTKDPANGFLEYKIQKDEQGNAVLKDGKPIQVFGPEDHLPQALLETYAKKRNLWGNLIRNNVPYFKPLRHE